MGGKSREREISFKSGAAILASLERQGYSAFSIDASDDLAAELLETKPDAAIIALHGRYGEDGTVQGMLEMMGIPYSGSGVLASSICMDKALTKQLLTAEGIEVAPSCEVGAVDNLKAQFAAHPVPFPLVVKPNREGSTIGISIVTTEDALQAAVAKALEFDSTVLLEQFIKGVEVTVGLINGKVLPALEIVPESGFYDYDAKYTKGKTEYIVPARISERVAELIAQQSQLIFRRLDLSGVARADFIIDENDRAVFLEVNTIPGMTETSLIPKAAEHIGMNFDLVVEEMLASVSLKA